MGEQTVMGRETHQQALSPKERKRLIRRRTEEERSAVGKCTKYTLFLVNFIFVIAGGALTAMGTYILVQKDKKVHDPLDFFLDPACIMCLGGSITFFVAFFGCLGALREIRCCLKFYYGILCLFLLGELTLAVLMFVSYYVSDVKSAVFPTDTFKQAIVHYRDDPDLQNLIDTLQKDLECCGWSDDEEGFLGWNDNIYFNCSIDNASPEKCSVPYSCCRTKEGDKINYHCGVKVFNPTADGPVPNDSNTYRIYTDGCVKALGDWINDHALIVGGVMLGILLPQIFVVVLSRNLIDMINIQRSKWT